MSTEQSIQNDHVVEVNYTLTNPAGDVLDTSDKGGPMAYIHGKNNIIPGLESALTGKTIGDKFDVEVAHTDAYGKKDPNMIQEVPKTQFPDTNEIVIGQQFQVQTPSGQPLIVTAIEIKDDVIVMDGNHPLAEVDLTFAVEVMSIRLATEQEVAHGHLHMDGGTCGGGDDKAEAK